MCIRDSTHTFQSAWTNKYSKLTMNIAFYTFTLASWRITRYQCSYEESGNLIVPVLIRTEYCGRFRKITMKLTTRFFAQNIVLRFTSCDYIFINFKLNINTNFHEFMFSVLLIQLRLIRIFLSLIYLPLVYISRHFCSLYSRRM